MEEYIYIYGGHSQNISKAADQNSIKYYVSLSMGRNTQKQ
jgi:hypothetical protein